MCVGEIGTNYLLLNTISIYHTVHLIFLLPIKPDPTLF